MNRLTGLIIATCALLGAPSARAIDLSVTARAEAGLDPATREFIANLPAQWRPQLAAIVNDAITRVDQSVADYLKKIEGVISDSVREIGCVAVASEDQMIEQII